MVQLNSDTNKPPRPPYDFTVCLEIHFVLYTSPLIEGNIYELSRKVSNFLPNFNLNIAFRSVKVRKLLSHQEKAIIDKFDKSNVIYQFDCTCADFNIGETGRTLLTRLKEHKNRGCSNICAHINTCEQYKNDAKNLFEKIKRILRYRKCQVSFF